MLVKREENKALKKKFSIVMIAILCFSFITMQPINPSVAPTLPKVFVDPPETKDHSKGVGSTFTIKVNVSNVENLYGWQINMTFNPAVVNTTTTSIVEGPFLKQAGTTMLIGKKVNNSAGHLLVGFMLKPPYPEQGASGNGTLVYITFNVEAVERATLLQFVTGTKLNEVVGGTLVPIEHTTVDGIFDNRVGNASPVAGFSAEPSLANVSDAIKFDASASYDPDAFLVSYRWDYGDNTTEIYMRELLRNINLTDETNHVYNRAGIYTVTLTVTDSDNVTSIATEIITVGHDIAVTGIKTSQIAVKRNETMTMNVTVSHKGYPYTGAFNVTLYVNETSIDTQTVIGMTPETEITLIFSWNTTGFDLGNYILKANSTIVEGDFNPSNNIYIDGVVTVALTNKVAYHVFIGGQRFIVEVESTSSISLDYNFYPTQKKIGFNIIGETGTGGFCNVTIPVDFLGGPYTVLFDGSPIIPEETTNGTHSFLYFTYTHSTHAHTVEIIGETVATPPVAIFTPSTTREIAGTPITFDATDSYDPDGTIKSYLWDLGDGTNGTKIIVEHAYAAAGNYTVILTVEDNQQLTNSTQVTVTIIDYPQASFSYSPPVPLVGKNVTFDASASQPKGGEIISYEWNFGDGATDTGITTTHAYSTAKNYTVVLNVTDSEGLSDTETKTVTISLHNIAVTDLSANPNTVKIGQQVSINITVVNEGNFTENFNVTAYYDDTSLQTLEVTDLEPERSKTITIIWNTTGFSHGTYSLKAVASTHPEETITDDNTKIVENAVTIQKLDSQLTISALPTTLTLGESTIISGTINPVRQGISVTIYYRLANGTEDILTTVTTDAQGRYTHTWQPEKTGTYEVKARWQGDATTLQDESDTLRITVNEPPSPINPLYIVSVAVIILVIAIAVYFLKIKKP